VSVLIVLLLCAGGDLDAAEKALAEKRPEEAIRLLGDLAEAEDVDARALLVLGRARLQLAEYPPAVEALLRALDTLPEDKALLRDIAWAHWGAARGDATFAQAYLQDALKFARRSDDQRLVADLLYELSRWQEALDVYAVIEETDENRLALTTRKGHCLLALERKDDAMKEYALALDEALRLGDLREAFDAAFRAQQTGKFLAWLDRKIAAEPKNVDFLLYRAYTREAVEMWEGAVEDFRAVLELRPGFLPARRKLARALVFYGSKQQRIDVMKEAEAMLRKLLAEDPADAVSWQSMQWLAGWEWANGRTERAYELLKLMLGIDPGDPAIVLNFAAMARRLGKYDEADAAFRTVLENDPEDPALLNDYAILMDGRGRLDEALKLWRRVLEVDPADRNALENLFTKAWERGDDEAMRRHLAAGLAVAENAGDPAYLRRWRWFRDRLRWAPSGFGRER